MKYTADGIFKMTVEVKNDVLFAVLSFINKYTDIHIYILYVCCAISSSGKPVPISYVCLRDEAQIMGRKTKKAWHFDPRISWYYTGK